MSGNTHLNKVLRILDFDAGTGGDHCAHGFRSIVTILLNEEGAFDVDVGPPEHRAVPHEGLCYAGSALDGEGAWVKHPISDVLPPTVLAGLMRHDPGGNVLGGELQADVRCTCSVPLPVNKECAARNGAAIVFEVVLNDGQPIHGEGRCGIECSPAA